MCVKIEDPRGTEFWVLVAPSNILTFSFPGCPVHKSTFRWACRRKGDDKQLERFFCGSQPVRRCIVGTTVWAQGCWLVTKACVATEVFSTPGLLSGSNYRDQMTKKV